jgi:hypothetical protein
VLVCAQSGANIAQCMLNIELSHAMVAAAITASWWYLDFNSSTLAAYLEICQHFSCANHHSMGYFTA